MLDEALDWRGHQLPPGALIVIKDCVAAKGGFLLIYFLKKLLASANSNEGFGQQPSTTRVVFVGVSEPFSHYNRIAKKQGCNLRACRDSGQLEFLDMLSISNRLTQPNSNSTQQGLDKRRHVSLSGTDAGLNTQHGSDRAESVRPADLNTHQVSDSERHATPSGKDADLNSGQGAEMRRRATPPGTDANLKMPHRESSKRGDNLAEQIADASGSLTVSSLLMVVASPDKLLTNLKHPVAISGADVMPSNVGVTAKSPLFMLYQKVSENVKGVQTRRIGDERTVILIDDASLLEVSAGGVQRDVLSFLQYCRALYSGTHRCSVVVLVHGDTDTSTGEATGLEGGGEIDRKRGQRERREVSAASLVQELDHIADVVLTVHPLSTGLAVDVHGQVSVVHWTDALSKLESRKRVQILQVKVTENNVLFFHPGGRF